MILKHNRGIVKHSRGVPGSVRQYVKNVKVFGSMDIFLYAYLYILVYLVPWQRFNHYFDFFCVFFGGNEIKCTFVTLLIQKTNFNLIHYENNQNRKHKQSKKLP